MFVSLMSEKIVFLLCYSAFLIGSRLSMCSGVISYLF